MEKYDILKIALAFWPQAKEVFLPRGFVSFKLLYIYHMEQNNLSNKRWRRRRRRWRRYITSSSHNKSHWLLCSCFTVLLLSCFATLIFPYTKDVTGEIHFLVKFFIIISMFFGSATCWKLYLSFLIDLSKFQAGIIVKLMVMKILYVY